MKSQKKYDNTKQALQCTTQFLLELSLRGIISSSVVSVIRFFFWCCME
jgi:hypothetical protein